MWFDALGNYITALDYADEGEAYRRYWHDNPRRVHVIGKGITRFHAIYWPAILLSAGVPLPATIFVHGYLTVDGQKISKSLGNAIDPVTLVEQYGIDAIRYYLLREVCSTEDGDFTLDRFIRACNANLADQLGNLLSRTIGMITRYYDGIVPAQGAVSEADCALIESAEALPERVDEAVARFATHEAMAALWEFIATTNKYVMDVRPWELAKQRQSDAGVEERLGTVLYNLVEALRLTAYLCTPFLPATASAIARQLGTDNRPNAQYGELIRWGRSIAGTTLQPAGVLFPKLELPPVGEVS